MYMAALLTSDAEEGIKADLILILTITANVLANVMSVSGGL